MNTFKLAQDMEASFNAVGHSMMSDEFACKLLAYCLVFGNDENVVLHTGLNAGLAIASQKFNIKGGEIPNVKLLPLFNQYVKELREKGESCEWL